MGSSAGSAGTVCSRYAARRTVSAAGAGSGKTYRLTSELSDLLKSADNDIRPEGIVATTFTRKAAAELQERLVEEATRQELSPKQLTLKVLDRALPPKNRASDLQTLFEQWRTEDHTHEPDDTDDNDDEPDDEP